MISSGRALGLRQVMVVSLLELVVLNTGTLDGHPYGFFCQDSNETEISVAYMYDSHIHRT